MRRHSRGLFFCLFVFLCLFMLCDLNVLSYDLLLLPLSLSLYFPLLPLLPVPSLPYWLLFAMAIFRLLLIGPAQGFGHAANQYPPFNGSGQKATLSPSCLLHVPFIFPSSPLHFPLISHANLHPRVPFISPTFPLHLAQFPAFLPGPHCS